MENENRMKIIAWWAFPSKEKLMRLSNKCSWYLVFPSLRLDNIARISYFRTLSTMNIYHEHDPHYFIFFFSWAKSLRLAEVDKKGNFQRIISVILNIFLWNKYDVREFFCLVGRYKSNSSCTPWEAKRNYWHDSRGKFSIYCSLQGVFLIIMTSNELCFSKFRNKQFKQIFLPFLV